MLLGTWSGAYRDSRNIEIITFDELYERAKFIVEESIPRVYNNESETPFGPDDDLPF